MRMIRVLRHFIFAILCLLSAAASSAHAHDSFTIVFEDYPPLEYMEGEEARGINVAIIREAFHRMGVVPNFRVMPWKRGLYELKAGSIAAMASGFKTEERKKFAIFPRHYLSMEINAIFMRADSQLRVDSLEDLRGRIVGVVREYSYGHEFDTHHGLKLDPVNNNPLLVAKLVDNRVDAIAGNLRVIDTLAKRTDVRHRIKPVYRLSSEPLYLFFSRARGAEVERLARRFDAAMDAMQADGTLKRLRSH